MFSALRVRNFRVYWLGTFVSLIGTWIQAVAQSWLVFRLTDSAFILGIVGFLTYIPIFILSVFGGVLADRVNKRKILITTQFAFMLLALLLAVLTQFQLITPIMIMVIACLNGVVMAFDAPSRQAVVVELVGRDNLFNAIALNSVAFNSTRIIGPALAAVLISTIGMSGCFYLNAISFFGVIAALFLIKVNHEQGITRRASALADLKDGYNFIRSNLLIQVLITMVGVVSLFGVSYVILMPIFADRVLGVGIQGLGILMSSVGIGAVLAALILARLGDFKYKGRLLMVSSFVFSIFLIFFSLSRAYLFSIFSLVFVGGSSIMAIALINTILQTNVPDEFRGRVMSAFMLTFAGFMPFGNLIAGWLAQGFGASVAVMLGGLICLIFFVMIKFSYKGLDSI
ncbi:MAG: MFS transporter [Candidatus Omnitrophica bacterium]|nr:MFS transporter [Candidatus Omnitrophota bacterium]